MKIRFLVLLFQLFFFSGGFAQNIIDDDIRDLYSKYSSSDYKGVIKKGLKLKDKYRPDSTERQWVLFLLGTAYKNINEKFNANVEFLYLLEINADFEPNLFRIKKADLGYFEDFKKKNLGSLHVYSSPSNAEVYLFGRLRGRTPLKIDRIVSNIYDLKIVKEFYEVYEEDVYIIPGDTSEVIIELSNEVSSGPFVINSTPAGATVLLNNEIIGVTPLQLNDYNSGVLLRFFSAI